MSKIFFLSVSLLWINSFSCLAQKDSLIYFSPEIGSSVGVGKELSRVYGFGGKITAAMSFPVLKNKVRIAPQVSLNYYGNNYDKGVRENNLCWNLGASIEGNRKVIQETILVPYVGAFYLLGKDYLTPRAHYQGDRIDLFTLQGVGANGGIKMKFKGGIFVNLSFQFVKPTGKLDSKAKAQIREQLGADSDLYEVVQFPPHTFSFNSLTLSLGYNLGVK